MDNDISLWQAQAKRQIHVGRDGEKEERKKRTGQEVREPGRVGLFCQSAVRKSQFARTDFCFCSTFGAHPAPPLLPPLQFCVPHTLSSKSTFVPKFRGETGIGQSLQVWVRLKGLQVKKKIDVCV